MEYLKIEENVQDEYVTIDIKLSDLVVVLKTLEMLVKLGEVDLMETYEALFLDVSQYGEIVTAENDANLGDSSTPAI